jgi:hypothetical protein
MVGEGFYYVVSRRPSADLKVENENRNAVLLARGLSLFAAAQPAKIASNPALQSTCLALIILRCCTALSGSKQWPGSNGSGNQRNERIEMKTRTAVMLAGLACGLINGVPATRAEITFSAGIEISSSADFYQPLSSYGAWVDVSTYGRCWHPSRLDRAWRPYTTGYWQRTDVGWYWVSDEPWAWACYHYGSWVYDSYYGWVWIPGTEWAPAWVSWREGGDYIGWAPCGPGGAVAVSPSWFVFIDVRHFHNRFRPSSLIVDNRTIIDRTHRVGDFRRERRVIGGAEQRVVFNPGPSVDTVQRATGQRFAPVPVQQIVRETPVPTSIRRRDGGATERSRTGQEQPRTGTQAPRLTPETRSVPPREQTPVVSQPTQRPAAPTPVIPETRRASEPTGREQSRVYPGNPAPTQPATAPKWDNVERPQAPPVPAERPPERPANPTGRERGYERSQEKAAPPAQPAPENRPARPAGPPPGQEKERDKDKPGNN